VFTSLYFYDSDAMHMGFGHLPGLFGWPEFSQVYLSQVEHDVGDGGPYEHSFDAETVLSVDPSHISTGWRTISSSDQVQVLNAICHAHQIEMAGFEELFVDGSDVLALIAAHPASTTEVLDAGASSAGRPFESGLLQR
jgi:hypothetical protein